MLSLFLAVWGLDQPMFVKENYSEIRDKTTKFI